MKLIGTIDSIDLSDAEKDRIGKSLTTGAGKPYQVLVTKAPTIRDSDFWRRAQRHFRITGFRDGHPSAVQMVLKKALDTHRASVGQKQHTGWPLIWPLYRQCAHIYLEHDMPELFELLRREEFKGGPGTITEQIFRFLRQRLSLHDVSLDEVRQLYEIWWFERTQHLEEIIANAWVEADAVRRMVDEGVGTMRRELSSAIETSRSDIQREVEGQAIQIRDVSRAIEAVRSELGELSAGIEARMSAVAQVQARDSSGGARHAHASGDLSSRQPTSGDHGSPRAVAELEALRARVEGLGRQMKELRQRLDHGERRDGEPPAAATTKPGVTTAAKAIEQWRTALLAEGFAGSSIGSCWTLLEVIKRSRIIVTDKPRLLVTLFKAVPDGDVRSIVASPMWMSEGDWKDSLAFISQDTGTPRILVIQDFDVGLQEAYLVPAAILWLANLAPQCANRVALVPSNADFAGVSPRVFEVAIDLTHGAAYMQKLERIGSTVTQAPPTMQLAQSGASLLGFISTKNVSTEDDLQQYAQNYGVSLPSKVLENFVNLYEGLQASLNRRDAGFIAQEAALLPWIRQVRGDAVSRALEEALRTVLRGD